MEPIPETEQVLDELDLPDGGDLRLHLRVVAHRVRALVPSCRGMSVALLNEGVTLTLEATDEEIAVLDAVQYLAGGPCVRSTSGREVIIGDTSELDEQGWHLFAAATAAHGIASTLSLPVLDGDVVVGSINLYAGDPHAFDDQHEQLAAVLGAWAGGAVRNADLGFDTRRAAQRAPEILAGAGRVEAAVGVLMARRGVSAERARRDLEEAAAAAGVPVASLAEVVLAQLGGAED